MFININFELLNYWIIELLNYWINDIMNINYVLFIKNNASIFIKFQRKKEFAFKILYEGFWNHSSFS
jgi:hypothetical protein